MTEIKYQFLGNKPQEHTVDLFKWYLIEPHSALSVRQSTKITDTAKLYCNNWRPCQDSFRPQQSIVS